MFTGLVETVGKITRATGDSPRRLVIASSIPNAEIQLGESIAIDGCCLTVVEIANEGLHFEAATETLARTTIGKLRGGDAVNLERAMRANDRLGGHIVAGHVDGVGVVREVEKRDSALYIGIDAPPEVSPYVAARGSVTVAGVSLTVTDVKGDRFYIGLIPHTLAVTNLTRLRPGSEVNLEADLIARYVARILETKSTDRAQPATLTKDFLAGKGF
jgi:riboflavin synthase